jgi:hypothetical protein
VAKSFLDIPGPCGTLDKGWIWASKNNLENQVIEPWPENQESINIIASRALSNDYGWFEHKFSMLAKFRSITHS